MKMKQLLPIALLAAMITPAVFATESGKASLDETLTLEMPNFIRITEAEGTNKSISDADYTISDDYTTLTITNNMIFGYHVVSNIKEQNLYLTATCPLESGTANALNNSAPTTPIIVFTNTTGTKASSSAVESALVHSDASTNANAIAIQFTQTYTPVSGSGAKESIVPAKDDTHHAIKIPISNGEFTLLYTDNGTNVANTLSTLDEPGTYQATVTLTNNIAG